MAIDETFVRHFVLTELAKQGERYLPVGVSARHVHLCSADIETLFGPGYSLSVCRPLVQPGQFAARSQVTLRGPKGELAKVRVLGPARPETQVEITLSDAARLGLKNVPVRMSGKLEGTPGLELMGPAGSVALDHGLIVAARHIHFSAAQAAAYGVHDGMVVAVRVGGARPCVLENVVCRCGGGHELELHLDTDEANACGLGNGDYAELLLPGEGCRCGGACKCGDCGGACKCGDCGGACKCGEQAEAPAPVPPAQEEPPLDLVTEQDIRDAAKAGRGFVRCLRRALVTPAAADRAAAEGIEILREAPAHTPAPRRAAPEPEVLELVTEADLNDAYRANRTEIRCTRGAVITDAALDRAAETGIRIRRMTQPG